METYPEGFDEFARMMRQAEREFPGNKRKLIKVMLLAMYRGDMTIDTIRRLHVEEMFRPSPNPTAPDGTDLVELVMNFGLGGPPTVSVAPPPPIQANQEQLYETLYRQARNGIVRGSVPVTEKLLPPNVNGRCTTAVMNGRSVAHAAIEIRPNMPYEWKYYVLIHELAHLIEYRLYVAREGGYLRTNHDQQEYAADCVAKQICALYGRVPPALANHRRTFSHCAGNPDLALRISRMVISCRTVLGLD